MKIHFLSIAQKELNDAVNCIMNRLMDWATNFSMNWTEPSAEPLHTLNPVRRLNQD